MVKTCQTAWRYKTDFARRGHRPELLPESDYLDTHLCYARDAWKGSPAEAVAPKISRVTRPRTL